MKDIEVNYINGVMIGIEYVPSESAIVLDILFFRFCFFF